MRDRNEVGRQLVELGVVTASQWAAAAAAGPTLADAADELERTPAWWATPGAGEPALSGYQAKHVRAGLPADRLAARLRVNQYLVLGELGRGGMGVVHKMFDRRAGRLLAVKRVRHPSADARRRFRREAAALARIDHPGVCRFLGADRVGGVDLLLTEYLPGATLGRLARRAARAGGRLPWADVARWAADLLDALDHLHRRGVVHRDVKPANVLVTAAGRAVLLDLGLAKLTDGGAAGDQLTSAGQVLGTQEYIPPEQWAGGDKAVPGSDLYALGGTVYAALAGVPPFPGESLAAVCRAHLAAPVPSVKPYRPDVPDGLDAVVRRMLAKEPAARGSARELRAAFGRLLTAADALTVDGLRRPDAVPPPAAADRPSSATPDPGRGSTASLLRELVAEVRAATARRAGRVSASQWAVAAGGAVGATAAGVGWLLVGR